ncbi:MAG: hypothetical protein LC781_04990 [Actinobacteria bacterium]|nr:hypothetical protein [Actinomycetota bacterium]
MAYELTNTTTGKGIRMLHREWELLLDLAERYGWRPAKGRDYARGGRFFHMDAVGMSAALARALPDIPLFYIDGLTEEERSRAAPLRELEASPGYEQGDPLVYFSGPGRVTLEHFIRIASGPFEVRPSSGFSGKF